MGLLDTLKAKAGVMKGKAGGFVQQHEEQIGRGLDKAAKTVDSRTKGKYRDRIETGAGKAKGALGRFSHQNAEDGTGTTGPGGRTGPGSQTGTAPDPGTGPETGSGPGGSPSGT
ncbi:antitoxin [Streptomyces sp. NPDC018031]|uniref:antitoxin n=1 Tax=Streptomyces sp. NPDC018031 TaxID=3365033 RepID=UPI0037BA138B